MVLSQAQSAFPTLSSLPFDPYRERLTLLSSDDRVLSVIAQAGLQRSWWSAARQWKRRYGRFDPNGTPYVTMLYETVDTPQLLCLVEVFTEEPTELSAAQIRMPDSDLGWFRITRFPYDLALPGLAVTMAESGQPQVLRYRPHKRCTIRFEASNGSGVQFAKVFGSDEGRQIHEDGQTLWEAANVGGLEFSVASPGHWDTETQTVWQGSVAGKPIIKQLFGSHGPDLGERLGRAAASLSISDLSPGQQFGREDQLAASVAYGKEISRRAPWLKPAISSLLSQLTEIHVTSPNRPLRPIHAAPHAHQWLDDGTRLGLVDFDRFTLGDPELDVATFITEMDFENWNKVRGERINRRFVAGYEAVAGPLDYRLLRAYCTHKRLAKTMKTTQAIRADGDIRAERNLGRTLVCVMVAS